MSDWDWVITFAGSVQQECVTLIRKNKDRMAVSKRERELSRTRRKRGTEWAQRESQTAAETQRQGSKKRKEKLKGVGSWQKIRGAEIVREDTKKQGNYHDIRRKGKETGGWEERWFPRAPLKEGISRITPETWRLFIRRSANYYVCLVSKLASTASMHLLLNPELL